MRMVFVGENHKYNDFMDIFQLEHGLGLTDYYRFDPILLESLLDPLDASPEAINQLKEVSDQYVKDNDRQLDKVAKILINHYISVRT